MADRTVPWWRRALEFAWNGLRSGFGWFRRNGLADPEPQTGGEPENEMPENEMPENELPEDDLPENKVQEDKTQEKKEIETIAPRKADPENGRTEPEKDEPAPENGEAAAEKEWPEKERMAAGELNNNPLQQQRIETGAALSAGPEGAFIEAAAPAAAELKIAAGDPLGPDHLEKADDSDERSDSDELSIREEPSDREEPEDSAEEEPLKHPSQQSEPAAAETKPAAEERAPAPEPPAAEPVAEPPAEEPVPKIPAEPEQLAPPVPHEPAAAPIAEAEPASAPAAEPVPPPQTPLLPFAAEPAPERTTAEKVAAALKARREDDEQSPFSVIVGQVYEGPLDLLLDLIRKQDIDIYDIHIAKITAQFLAYVNRLRSSDMDVAGEFIYTASLLIHIKSRMLLPRVPAAPGEEGEDPRRELVERLLEHERFKNAAQMLQQKQLLEAATWTNPGVREFQDDSAAEPEIAADTGDLVRVFHQILERTRNRPILNVAEDSVTVAQMIQFLVRRLTMEDKPVALRRLLSHTRSEQALIALFLALLELVRLQAILLRQDLHFSEIFIKKSTGFDALMNQGLAGARDDWR